MMLQNKISLAAEEQPIDALPQQLENPCLLTSQNLNMLKIIDYVPSLTDADVYAMSLLT